MKILYVINSFNRAGAERLVCELSRKMSADGCKIAVAALYRNGYGYENEICDELGGVGIRTYIIGKRGGKDRIKTVRALLKIIRLETPDLIHAHCSVPMLMSKIAGFLSCTPVVCTVHNTRGYPAMREFLSSWMSKRYVAIGGAAEEYMKRSLHIKSEKITRIYNAVDVSKFRQTDSTEDFWQSEGFLPSTPVAVNVGRVTHQKNQLCFVKALKLCAEQGTVIQGAILGDFSEEDGTYIELRKYIEDNRLGESVRLLGNRSNIRDYLNNAECFVMTSRYEGLSVAYLEAAACNVPIITTDMPFAREIEEISPGSVITAQDDHHAVAEALIKHSYATRTEESMERFRRAFSFDIFADRHLKLYKETAKIRE